jgi:N-acetylmuramic acid 6-phosphate etherase
MAHEPLDYDALPTEQPSGARQLDTRSALELVDLIHEQDMRALTAVGQARQAIARTADAIAGCLAAGGRLIYVGAGTSGRLATLDAAECPPTFGTRPGQVVALIAGGTRALRRAAEGAEDSRSEGRRAIQRLEADGRDLVCGVSASGVTPFVLGALAEARRRRCRTALVTCAPLQQAEAQVELPIALAVGGETVAGSTRMKAGLAQKAVLHTLTTAAMVRLGKVYDNLMVDVRPTSRKLRHRARRIVAQLTGLSPERAGRLLERAGGNIKAAVVMHRLEVSRDEARRRLARAGGRLRDVIGDPDVP